MTGLNPIMIGATIALAAAAIGVTAVLSPKTRAAFVYAILVMMAGIYVGLAIAHVDGMSFVTRAGWSVLMVESFIALGLMLAGLGVLGSSRPWLLGALILLHGGIDLIHLLMKAAHSPDWYAFLCIIFDAMVGVAAIWLLSAPKDASPPSL